MSLPTTIANGAGGHLAHHDEVHDKINQLEAAIAVTGNLPIATAAGALGDLAPGAAGFVLTADPAVPGKAKWAAAPRARLSPPAAGADAVSLIQGALTALGGAGDVELGPGTYPAATTIEIGAGQRLVSEDPDSAVITYSGTATAVRCKGRMSGMRGVKVLCTNGAATVHGVEIAAPSTDTLYWRLIDCTISASTRVTGQSGIYFTNTSSTAIFFGQMVGGQIENFGTNVNFAGNNPTFGCNANLFVGVHLHNANVQINLANTYANVFDPFTADLFLVGITASSGAIRNRINGRMEGGTGSQGYTLAAGSQENVLTLDDNTVIASTDAGLQNLTTITGIGQPKAWDTNPTLIANFDPTSACFDPATTGPITALYGTVPTAANSGQFVRIKGITKAINLTGAKIVVGVTGGNVAVGLYEFDGTTFTRKATTGSVATAVAGQQVLPFTAGYIVDPRRTYYALLTASSLTPKFLARPVFDQACLDWTGPNVQGRPFYATVAGGMFPPPSSVALTALSPSGGTTDSKELWVAVT